MIARAEALPPADRAKLANILGRLGSEFDGERAAAGLLASRMLQDRGLSWADLLTPALASSKPRSMPPASHDWRGQAAWCCKRPELLNPWERDFTARMGGLLNCSDKQRAVIDRLVARRVAAEGAR